MPARFRTSCLVGTLAISTVVSHASAQSRSVTAAEYAHAEKFLGYNTTPLVDHAVVRPSWLDASHFLYTDHDATGDTFRLVDAATGKGAPLFDQVALARSLGALAGGRPLDATKLPLRDIAMLPDGRYRVSLRGIGYACDRSGSCAALPRATTGIEPGALSPDKTTQAFIRGWNLWVRDVATGGETQLTTDGVENYGYATDNAGWQHTARAIVAWSPDGKQIATFQQDQRTTGEMYLVSTTIGHPKLEAWKYPFVGDTNVTMIERVIVDVPTHKVLRLQMPPDQHRSTLCDDVSCGPDGDWTDVRWAPDGATLAFVSTSRDHKHEWFRVADAKTGTVRTVFEEEVPTYYESGAGTANWQYLPASNEVIWFSERTNWGHLYLYDLVTGRLKRAITTGEGNVTQVLRVDPKTRTLWFRGVGRERGVDPYVQQFYRVSLDGGAPRRLTAEAADHQVALSPDGTLFLDTYSTPTTPPVTVLRSLEDGHVTAAVASADISRLKAAGWVPPVPITVKGRDGTTDLYGLLFKPTQFDSTRRYPIINYVYPGPQVGSVGSRSFGAARGDNQALAELGFIVVAIDGMGTPLRTKAFHDAYFGNVGDNTLPDQVAALRELAKRHAWIDLERAGMWGHSGGGNATADAMFRYPDLFKVGWAESGNHDNRVYEDDWAEKWQGLLVTRADGTGNYDDQANQNHVAGLKGHLMLTHGTLDDNVPPQQTLLLADALIKANKNFDMLMIPNVRHGYGAATAYVTRRRWDYFVRYLAGNIPPDDFAMTPPAM